MNLLQIFITLLIIWNVVSLCLLFYTRQWNSATDLKGREISEYSWGHHVIESPGLLPKRKSENIIMEFWNYMFKNSETDTQLDFQFAMKSRGARRSGSSEDYDFRLLNIPEIYTQQSKPSKYRSKGCFNYPPLHQLKFDNIYWQMLETVSETFYIFGAYYDDRKLLNGKPCIRLLAMIDRIPPPDTICVLWFKANNSAPFPLSMIGVPTSKTTSEHLWRKSWGQMKNETLHPFLVTCPLPTVWSSKIISKNSTGAENGTQLLAVLESVSLVLNKCSIPITNNIRLLHKERFAIKSKSNANEDDDLNVHEEASLKNQFAVCVKGLDFPKDDLSIRLVEWINLLNILGAHRIFFYEFDVHPNVAKVFDYFSERNITQVMPLTLPGGHPNFPGLRNIFLRSMVGIKRLNEIIPYNDCLYRNLHKYRFLVLLDIDEVIMPLISSTWEDLLKHIAVVAQSTQTYLPSSYSTRNVYFFNDINPNGHLNEDNFFFYQTIPSYLYMSRLVIRAQNFTKRGRYVKCFHDTARVRALHNHYPFSCLVSPCKTFDISPAMAEMQHYRSNCHDISAVSCQADFKNKTVVDTSIWRYADKLVPLVIGDLRSMKLIT